MDSFKTNVTGGTCTDHPEYTSKRACESPGTWSLKEKCVSIDTTPCPIKLVTESNQKICKSLVIGGGRDLNSRNCAQAPATW